MPTTPVLFLIFNRPETTALVFEAIRQVKPERLFIAADGPRTNNIEDIEKCRNAREIALQIDWKCEVQTLFRENNLGCKYAVSSAISWFFQQVEEGIILEDDTLPNNSFFSYCTELLNAYKHNEQIMHISGTNFQKGNKRGNATFYFSRYFHVWGWATWRRAWVLYDINLSNLDSPNHKDYILNRLSSRDEYHYWSKVFDAVKQNKINTWDYQWLFSIWANNGICITPNTNLVSNLGFGADATHGAWISSELANLQTEEIQEIVYPEKFMINKPADKFNFQTAVHVKPVLTDQIRNQMSQLIPQSVKKIIKHIV